MIADAAPFADAIGQAMSALTTTVDPTLTTVTMPGVLEVGAALCGALTGAMVACERKLDIVGVATLGLVTGLAIVTFFFRGAMDRMNKFIFLFDILSVALFTFAGADKALTMGYSAVSCALMGVITAVGGGMLRDICLGEVPLIFRRGTYYAIASIAGAAIYLGLVELHVVKAAAALACVVVTIALRLLSVRYSLLTSAPVDLTPRVSHAWHRLREEGERRQAERRGEACPPAEPDDTQDSSATGKDTPHA